MFQNTKKTVLSTTRWSLIVDFLHCNQARIKSLLRSGLHIDAIRTDIFLDNIIDGIPRLSAELYMPGGGNKILVYSLPRPPLFNPREMQRKIEALEIMDIMLTVSNQIEMVY